MDFFETLQKRVSVRSYEIAPVPDGTILKIVEAARIAPSAFNRQPWHFIAVRDEEKRKRIAKGCPYGKFLAKTPVVIVACGDRKASPDWHVIDTVIALDHLILAATALGLGTCWIGFCDKEEIRDMLQIPENLEVVALTALGYPAKKRKRPGAGRRPTRRRKPLQKIMSSNTFGERPRKRM